jgi:hypothetical protein
MFYAYIFIALGAIVLGLGSIFGGESDSSSSKGSGIKIGCAALVVIVVLVVHAATSPTFLEHWSEFIDWLVGFFS